MRRCSSAADGHNVGRSGGSYHLLIALHTRAAIYETRRGNGRMNLRNPLEPLRENVQDHMYLDHYYFEAVFAAAKALVNFVKEKSGKHDLDGAALMRTVFSRKDPILLVNDLASQTDEDEQEGLMHVFEGAVLALRNPGGHAFPQGTAQRALEYIQLLSLLAYQVEESRRRPHAKSAG